MNQKPNKSFKSYNKASGKEPGKKQPHLFNQEGVPMKYMILTLSALISLITVTNFFTVANASMKKIEDPGYFGSEVNVGGPGGPSITSVFNYFILEDNVEYSKTLLNNSAHYIGDGKVWAIKAGETFRFNLVGKDITSMVGGTYFEAVKQVVVKYKIGNGSTQEVSLGYNYLNDTFAIIQIPAGAQGMMSFWFEITDLQDKIYYVRNGDKNFFVQVLSQNCDATIFFKAPNQGNWANSLVTSGALRAGKTVCISYELQRLRDVGAKDDIVGPFGYSMSIAPSAVTNLRFRGESGKLLLAVNEIDSKQGGIAIVIPSGTSKLEIWTVAESHIGFVPSAYDTDFGKNFWFEVQK